MEGERRGCQPAMHKVWDGLACRLAQLAGCMPLSAVYVAQCMTCMRSHMSAFDWLVCCAGKTEHSRAGMSTGQDGAAVSPAGRVGGSRRGWCLQRCSARVLTLDVMVDKTGPAGRSRLRGAPGQVQRVDKGGGRCRSAG